MPELPDVEGFRRALSPALPGRRVQQVDVRDEPDPSCPRCGTRLTPGRSGGRASLWCPRCQPDTG